MSYHYPSLDEKAEWALGVIATLASENPDYFTNQDCPYEGRTLILLQSMCAVPAEVEGDGKPEVPLHEQAKQQLAQVVNMDEMETTIEQDLMTVLTELKLYGKTLTNSDNTERMSYFRTVTSLLEKLVALRERAAGVKQVKEFESAVLGVMEDVLTSEQRTQVMDQLRSILSKGRNDPIELDGMDE